MRTDRNGFGRKLNDLYEVSKSRKKIHKQFQFTLKPIYKLAGNWYIKYSKHLFPFTFQEFSKYLIL